MTATLIVFAVLVAGVAFLLLGGRGRDHEPTVHRRPDDDVDRAELERAEREVREASSEDEVRDWGPGTPGPRPPERL